MMPLIMLFVWMVIGYAIDGKHGAFIALFAWLVITAFCTIMYQILYK